MPIVLEASGYFLCLDGYCRIAATARRRGTIDAHLGTLKCCDNGNKVHRVANIRQDAPQIGA